MFVLASVSVRANVTLSGLFADHMVLQRELPVSVYGTAEPGEKVAVAFAGQKKSVTAGSNGQWSVKLDPMKASKVPAAMTVSGKNEVIVQDVAIGDVWVCSGQSNMEFVLSQGNRPDDIKAAEFPLIRQFKVPHNRIATTCEEVKSAWVVCSPQSAASFSAVGYYFARKVQKETGVPIGLIDSSWSGTPIEPWIAPVGKEMVPEPLREIVKLPFDGPADWSLLYNGMIHPLIKFPIKGVLWYQGESNAIFNKDDNREESYHQKMRGLVAGWRKVWNIGEFPFYYVQLANFQNPNDNPEGGEPWARICTSQLRSLSIPNTGMAVAIDLADVGNPSDIHPKNKLDVGERLAAWALAKDYGKKSLVYSGPLYKRMKIEGGKIRIGFDSVGSGLIVATKKGYDPMVKDPQGKLKRFAIAGDDKKWFWADAVIDRNTVLVSSPSVPKPVAVRYAFAANPDGCNLYNNDGFPASPFRTDIW
jgi:sialate O-acetylesterase